MHTQADLAPTGPVGLLYPGEMGTAVARLLRRDGRRVVTTAQGRGPATARNARDAGLEELDSLPAVVRVASVLLVLVPPAAALAVAEQVRECLRPGARLLYVDLNSVSPDTARALAGVFAKTAVDFVDGAISGPAACLDSRCVLYLSGPRADAAAALFAGKMPVQVVGEFAGQASALRMLLSGLTKGVTALFVEMALAAQAAGVLDRLLAAYRLSYPGIMEVVERMLPTYPRHAVRRGQELAEVEATVAQLGLCPTVLPGIRRLTAAMGECPWTGRADRPWSMQAVLDELHARRLLHREPAAPTP